MKKSILILVLFLISFKAFSQKISVEELLSKTEKSLDKIETLNYKTNRLVKNFSDKDTIYQEAICSIFIEPKDKIGMHYITNIVWDDEFLSQQIYNGVNGSQVNINKDKTLRNFEVLDDKKIKSIRGFGNARFLYFSFFNKNQRFTRFKNKNERENIDRMEVSEEKFENSFVYVLSVFFKNHKDSDAYVNNGIDKYYIRKSDYLPIARSSYGEFQGMKEYEFVTIDYLGINTLKSTDFKPYTKIEEVNIEAIYEQNKSLFASDSFANKNNKPKEEFKQVSVDVDLSNKKFPFNDFNLSESKTIKLSDLKGKVVLLDFWYRSCFPCIKAMPELAKLQKEFENDLVVIGINDRDEQDQVADFLKYKKVNYSSTYKSELHISNSLKINAFPTTIIIDKNGAIIFMETGFNKEKIKKTIKDLIKQ